MAVKSFQDRHDSKNDSPVYLLNNFLRQITNIYEQIPEYKSDTRLRDAKLLQFLRSENILSSFFNAVIAIDKSRGWSLVGPQRQVNKYGQVLHSVDNGNGWRTFISKNALSWYGTNVGFVSELGSKSKYAPIETMWHVDPTKVVLTGNIDYPLEYHGKNVVKLKRHEYIHSTSMPSVEEQMNGVGFCALERCLNFTRIMIGLYQHHLEKLGVSPPKGILFGSGITKNEYENAYSMAKEAKREQNAQYYDGVLALMASNAQADLKMIGLSTLPDNFSLSGFIETLVNAYAVALGFDAYSLGWIMSSNNLGRGQEAQTIVSESKDRGALDFALTFQEQIQSWVVPDTVSFTFDERSNEEELIDVDKMATYVEKVLKPLIELGQLNQEQANFLLAEQGIIPKSWTEEEKNTEYSDLQELRTRYFESAEIQRAIYEYPEEPIVLYRYNSKNELNKKIGYKNIIPTNGNYYVLWERASDAKKKTI